MRTRLPNDLTPQLIETICDNVRIGVTPHAAAYKAGANARTLERWFKKAAQDPTGPEAYLVEKIDEANAEFMHRNVKIVYDDAAQNPENAKWLLEKRFPEIFGKRAAQQIEISGPNGEALEAPGAALIAAIEARARQDAAIREKRHLVGVTGGGAEEATFQLVSNGSAGEAASTGRSDVDHVVGTIGPGLGQDLDSGGVDTGSSGEFPPDD